MSDVFRLLDQFDRVIDAHVHHGVHDASSLKQENERLRVLLAAVWEVIKEHCGALDEQLERKLTSLLARANGAAATAPAPSKKARPAKKAAPAKRKK